ncbi:hypothetical protein [Lentzea sp. NPDC051838]|uniref:hypothetical protein n=1 Tax=Lentzea sp. NPDC051838 TaxID=3154849 RepID=UPI0034127994
MTPAHGNDSAEGESEKLGDAHSSTASTPLRRTRRTRRRHSLALRLRHPVPGRPSTVWPCAQDNLFEGTGLLASWMLTAVVKIVTTYTRPGQRVLLLEPAPHPVQAGPRTTNDTRVQSRPGRYAGLHEAGWTVVRLGRGVQTETAGPHPERVGERLDLEFEDGLRESVSSQAAASPAGQPTRGNPEPDSALDDFSPDRYDLVITAAEPGTLGWLRPANWGSVLTPAGILAVITRSDRSTSRLVDPASSLVRAADCEGLRYLDRITLLRAPIRDGALVVATPTERARSLSPTRPPAPTGQHVPVHDDLLVFSRRPVTEVSLRV